MIVENSVMLKRNDMLFVEKLYFVLCGWNLKVAPKLESQSETNYHVLQPHKILNL